MPDGRTISLPGCEIRVFPQPAAMARAVAAEFARAASEAVAASSGSSAPRNGWMFTGGIGTRASRTSRAMPKLLSG